MLKPVVCSPQTVLYNTIARADISLHRLIVFTYFLEVGSLPEKKILAVPTHLAKFCFPGVEEPGKFVPGLSMVRGAL